MTRIVKAFTRAGKAARYLASTLVIAAGIFYLLSPPRTTSQFFEGEWPAMAWGAMMLVAGAVIIWGIKSKILQIEQYGMLILGVSSGLLSSAQSLVMFGDWPSVTWTRGGGTLILWALVAFAGARYFELSAEIRSSRLANVKLEG